jgi:FSR family fosmidomycin resistance protein-like MFS transporter
VVICRSVVYYGLSAFIVVYAMRRFHVGTVMGAAVLTTVTAVGAVATVTGGWLADRWGRVNTVRLGYALGIPGILALVFAPDLPVAFAAAGLIGVSIFLPFSIHVALGQEYLPSRIGTASGATLGLSIAIGGLVSPALGALADAAGPRAVIATLIICPIAALGFSLRLHDPRPVTAAQARDPHPAHK